MRLSGWRSAAAAVTVVLAATSCSGSGADRPASTAQGGVATGQQASSTPSPVAPAGPVSVAILPAAGTRSVSPAEPVIVRARNGALSSVRMTNAAGRQVQGRLSADRATWSSTEPLGYGRQYMVSAVATRGAGSARATSIFTTVSPVRMSFPSFFPPPTMRKVGVGQPIAVIFSSAPADRAAAERALKVTTQPAVEGGWYWFDDRTVHWRPRTYWAPGTQVTVRAQVYGVDLGDGVYGETDRELRLTIGPAKIATIDDRTKIMTVSIGGRVVRRIPVSMGRPGSTTVNGKKISFLTQSGIHVVQEKYSVKRMTSASYGLPADYSLGYDQQIPLAVRISNSGEFVHSAPWSVKDQGRRNVSHGCVNIAPQHAKWFYSTFSYGDVVDIRNTGATLKPTDGFGDWNIPWPQWLAGSALR